jgi:hypothetical protein
MGRIWSTQGDFRRRKKIFGGSSRLPDCRHTVAVLFYDKETSQWRRNAKSENEPAGLEPKSSLHLLISPIRGILMQNVLSILHV